MNTKTTRLVTPRATLSRAQFSPLSRRAVVRAQSDSSRSDTLLRVPGAGSLTPASPTLSWRLWIPNVLDRLQMPLSRIRE